MRGQCATAGRQSHELRVAFIAWSDHRPRLLPITAIALAKLWLTL